MALTFTLEKDGKKWHAYCPELHGCHTFGSTKEEALKHLKDAVLLYVVIPIHSKNIPKGTLQVI